MILTVAILGGLLATVVGLSIAPKYTAIAEIAVEPPPSSLDGRVPSEGEEIIIDTHVAMLSSRDQMERVLGSLPSGTGAKTVSLSIGMNGSTDPVSRQDDGLSLKALASRLRMWSGSSRKRDTALDIDRLERGAKIMQARRSRIISVGFTSNSPQQAATVANRIVRLYVDAQNEQKRASMSLELARLGERIAGLAKEAEDTRSAAQAVVDLRRRQDELRAEIEFSSADVRVASLAKTPERPSSSNPLLFILPAAVISAIGASAFAVIVHRLDRGLRSERDVSDALGIPCIGLVPEIAGRRRARPHRYLLAEPFSDYSEAIRSVAATLEIVAKNEESQVVLVSSSVPMEGRSTLALSIAAYVSALGRRVLLVDLDFRQRSFLGSLAGKAARAVLDGHLQNRPPAEFIQEVTEFGFDYLPVPRRVDPLSLFASEQMSRLLRDLRNSYDCVIIDGPPLLGVTEARLLPALADKVLFVVKWRETRCEVAQNALRLLRDAGCLDKEWRELPIAILNQVDLQQHAQYGFGDVGELRVKYRKYYTRSMKAWRSAAIAAGSTSGSRPDDSAGSPLE